jgi:hypothetical protein
MQGMRNKVLHIDNDCAMSLTDDMVKMGGDHEKAAEISNKHGREVFKFMLENGMIPGELGQSKLRM